MLTIITATAALAAAQPAQTAPVNPSAQHTAQPGQMDHSKMGHSGMGQQGAGCCAKTADSKVERQMMKGQGAPKGSQGQNQGHSGH